MPLKRREQRHDHDHLESLAHLRCYLYPFDKDLRNLVFHWLSRGIANKELVFDIDEVISLVNEFDVSVTDAVFSLVEAV
jgi:hypothetical protein